MSTPIYNDGRYMVSSSIVATPSRFYPLGNTTASVRRDPLWAGVGIAALSSAAILTYGDLLYGSEILWMIAGSSLAMFSGWQIVILRLDAPGHPRTFIVSHRSRIWKVFAAIRASQFSAQPTSQPLIMSGE